MSTTSTPQAASAGVAWGPFALVTVVHLGALLAFVPAYFSWSALLVCVLLHWFTGGIGICLTYHRLLTHRSFACRPRWLEYVLTAIGCAALEGGPTGWVADHRMHHAHSDEPDDVHSPNRGFAWAHMMWWLTPDAAALHDRAYYERWAPDLLKDPVHNWLDRFHLIFPVTIFIALYAIGGMPWLVWGGFVRTAAVLHSTWLINSATHIWGYVSHPTRDQSRNLWWAAILTYGEGWHNNHHAYPTSARHGFRWWEVDMTHWAIVVMQTLGLAYNVKYVKARPNPDRVAATGGPATDVGPIDDSLIKVRPALPEQVVAGS